MYESNNNKFAANSWFANKQHCLSTLLCLMILQPGFLLAFSVAVAYGADVFRDVHAIIPKSFYRKYMLCF